MDGLATFALVFIILSVGCLSNQMVPDEGSSNTVNTGANDTSAIIACATGRGAAGGCVVRIYCNYNTSNIDLTVYGPPGYRNPCQGKVCCPTEYILPVTPANTTDADADDDIDFDDD